MKIATFNVNSIRSRLDLTVQWLQRTEPDVVCFQEIKVENAGFPAAAFHELGYQTAVFGQKAYNGVAICSRLPMENVQNGFGDPVWDQQSRVMAAAIGGVTVINGYFPHGGERGSEKHGYKLGFYERMTAYCAEALRASDAVCVVGDLNVTRSDLDLWDPGLLSGAIGTMPEERAALEQLLAVGLVDGFRERHPERSGFTWWDYVGGGIWKDHGMRIDYILTSPGLDARLESVEPDLWPRRRREPKPSDHTPVIAQFRD